MVCIVYVQTIIGINSFLFCKHVKNGRIAQDPDVRSMIKKQTVIRYSVACAENITWHRSDCPVPLYKFYIFVKYDEIHSSEYSKIPVTYA